MIKKEVFDNKFVFLRGEHHCGIPERYRGQLCTVVQIDGYSHDNDIIGEKATVSIQFVNDDNIKWRTFFCELKLYNTMNADKILNSIKDKIHYL